MILIIVLFNNLNIVWKESVAASKKIFKKKIKNFVTKNFFSSLILFTLPKSANDLVTPLKEISA